MGLKIWLPLNGDIHNQGIDNIDFINRNVTFSTGGKIGQCAEFNGSNACLYIDNLILNNQWSYGMWYYHYTRDSGWTVITILNNTGSDSDTQLSFWYNNNSSKLQSTANGQYNSSINTPTKDAWHHFFATFDGATLSTYLDGELINTKAITATLLSRSRLTIGARRSGESSWAGYWQGKINDFRLYDYCLSPAEVKEISQGLVLHYKLDDSIKTFLPIDYQQLEYIESTGSSYLNTNYYFNPETDACKVIFKGNDLANNGMIFASSGGKYFWFYYYGSSGIRLYANNGSGQQGIVGISRDLNQHIMEYKNKHYYIDGDDKGSLSNTYTQDSGTIWLFSYGGANYVFKGRIYYTEIFRDNIIQKVYIPAKRLSDSTIGMYELINNEFIPSASSTAFTAGTANTTIEIQDSSGYNNNANSNGSVPITLDTDSPKYNYSTKFATGARIAMPVGSASCLPTTAITVSIWYKSSTATNRFLSCTEGGGWNFEINSSRASFPFYISGKGYGRVNATQNFYSDNQWHMLTASYDGISTAKIYLDGVLNNTATITSGWENLPIYYSATTPLTLGAEAQTIASPINGTYVGNLSDLRIYCTALSDDDIRQLYKVSAAIDNKNSTHAFEMIEETSNEITKQGQIKGSLFNEVEGMEYLKYDPYIYIEPDGSCWVHIFHHNQPSVNGVFGTSCDYANSCYLDINRWFNMELCNHVTTWELMVKQKYLMDDPEKKWRWIQTANPMSASFDATKAANITRITNGYSSSHLGGYYYLNTASASCLAANNGTNGNWWGAVGANVVYNTGIPGYVETNSQQNNSYIVKTGYMDVYLRIDNLTNTNSTLTRINKNKIWLASNIIER